MTVTRWLTMLAAFAWLLLAALTAASGVLLQTALAINLIVAAMFLGIAVLLWLRMRAVTKVRAALSSTEAMAPLLRTEAVSSAGMLVLGASLLFAATHRVFVEGVAVFG